MNARLKQFEAMLQDTVDSTASDNEDTFDRGFHIGVSLMLSRFTTTLKEIEADESFEAANRHTEHLTI